MSDPERLAIGHGCSPRSLDLAAGAHRERPPDDAGHKDAHDEHQRGRPGRLLIRHAGRLGVDVDRQWDRGHRLVHVGHDRVREDRRREEQRRRLAGRPGHRHDGGGDDPADCRRQDHGDHSAGTCRPERHPTLAQGRRHQCEHLLGGPRDQWHHHDREPDRCSDRALTVTDHQQAEDEDTDDDRRHAGEHVQGQPHELCHLRGRELDVENCDQNAHGHRDQGRHGGHDDRADDGIRDAAAGLEDRCRRLREEVDAEGRQALAGHRDDHDREDDDRQQRRGGADGLHDVPEQLAAPRARRDDHQRIGTGLGAHRRRRPAAHAAHDQLRGQIDHQAHYEQDRCEVGER